LKFSFHLDDLLMRILPTIAPLARLFDRFLEWRRCRRSLQLLAEASDRDLQDLGISRQDVMYLSAGRYRIERPPRRHHDEISP
jgi:uncharacterized protein YjiS (DUF1127 family)